MSGPGTYYVNKNAQPNGDREIHNGSDPCRYFHEIKREHLELLGQFSNCHDALARALEIYPEANGCMYCAGACHTR